MREGIVRALGFIKGRISSLNLPPYSLETLPIVDHTPVDTAGVNRISLYFHSRRRVIPAVAERLRVKAGEGKVLYGISGRPATVDWDRETRTQVDMAAIPLREIKLTPKGVSTLVSKAHAIAELDVDEFSDDNLRTILYLSTLFPDVQFNFIRHRFSDMPVDASEMSRRGNIRKITIAQWSDPSFKIT